MVEVKVLIYDCIGNLVDRQSESMVLSKTHEFIWDLRNLSGTRVSSGNYVTAAVIKSEKGEIERVKTTFAVK